MLGAEDVEWAGGTVPDGGISVHEGVVDQGSVFAASPARRTAAGEEKDVHAGRH